MLPYSRTARVTIRCLTPLTPVTGWGASLRLTGSARCFSDKQDPGMTHVSILRTIDGARREKKSNDVVDHPILLFSLSPFPSFFPLYLRCNRPSLSTIKGGHDVLQGPSQKTSRIRPCPREKTQSIHRDLGVNPSLDYL
jgi:hypothetical protein